MVRRKALVVAVLACALGCAVLGAAAQAPAVEVNEANQAELEMVRGIGPGLSEQILVARRKRPFRDWADLMARLSGIGPARAMRLSAAGLTVAHQAWPTPAPAASEPASR